MATLFQHGRGVGITELLQSNAELLLVVLFALVTQFGDVWFLFLLGSVLYIAGEYVPRWGIDRRRGLFVIALVLSYVALIGVFKNIFVLPRPPGAGDPPVVEWLPTALVGPFTDITTAEGPGFPSGHALGSTMVWGGLALVLDRGTFRMRIGVASAVVVLVSLSRLVLGVHYLVDVIVGAALGVVVLGLLYRLAERGIDPERALLAAVAAGPAGLLVGVSFESVAAVGSAVGAWFVWRGVAESTPPHPGSNGEVVVGLGVLTIAGGLFGVVYAVEPPLLLTFLATGIAVGGVVGAPVLGERLV